MNYHVSPPGLKPRLLWTKASAQRTLALMRTVVTVLIFGRAHATTEVRDPVAYVVSKSSLFGTLDQSIFSDFFEKE